MKGLKYQTLALQEPAEHLLIVRFNRPEVRNAISTQVGDDMLDVFTRLIADPQDYRCVILTGTGDKAFSAGGDLKERNGMTNEQWLKQHHLFERMTLAVIDCPLPTIAAVNGVATFTSLTGTVQGTYQFIAIDGSLGTAVSRTFNISAPTYQLQWAAQPETTLVAGATLNNITAWV